MTITIDNTCQSCDVLQLFQRTAPVATESCGTYGSWEAVAGSTSTLDVVKTVPVNDGFCYQFKAVVTNNALSVLQEYTSASQVIVDRVAPAINIVGESLIFDSLSLDLNFVDDGVGLSQFEHKLNSASGVVVGPFSAVNTFNTSFNESLDNGLNRVQITAQDAAGNISSISHFVTADLTPPGISLIGIEEGGVYSSDLAIVYSLTQELSGVTVTVNGVERNDLAGLPDGSYVLIITGVDFSGDTVSKTVNFTIDNSVFSFNLLSPQNNRTFESGLLPIQYDSSKPLSSLSYSLDGAPVQTYTGAELDLVDGVYNLMVTAVSQDGDTSSKFVNFTVNRSVPALDLISPVNDTVYQNNSVALNYVSDSTVVIELDGNVVDPSTISLPVGDDGEHFLRITATHPVSNTVVTKSIDFFTDSVVPDVQITSPEPRIYTKADIPIEYKKNKSLNNVTYQLDGNSVAKLSNVTAGSHIFRMIAQDSAGRGVDETVAFQVAYLDISSPQDGASVVSNVIPPVLDFQYAASGNFDLYSVAIDGATPQILTNAQGPGSNIPLPLLPGKHEVALRGSISSQQVGTRTGFEIGAKNITVEPGSIDYTYSNCGDNFTNCDVQARLIVKNKGDFNVTEKIKVRFDHVDNTGYETFWFDVQGLENRNQTEILVPVFKASLGDLLAISIDPFSELESEWAEDNSYSVDFSAGQIVNIETALPSSTKYLEGVSVFNLMHISTAGPISIMQYRYGGWLFEQTSTSGTFDANMDMGLLSISDNCIEITALSLGRIVLDSATHCFNITELDLQGLTKYSYTWELHEGASKHVDIDLIDVKALLKQSALLRKLALLTDAAILPELTDNAEVAYKVYYDPGAIAGRADNIVTNWSNQGFLGGFLGLPNGRSIVVTTLRPSQNVCAVNGAVMISDVQRTFDLEERYQEEIVRINSLLFPSINSPSIDGLMVFFTNSTLFFESDVLLSVEDFFEKFDQGVLSDIISDARSNSLLDVFVGFFDLKLNVVGWVRGDIPDRAGSIGFLPIGPQYVNRFVGRGCVTVDVSSLKIRFDLNGYFESGFENVQLQLLTNSASIDVDALAYLSWGLPDIIPGIDLPTSVSAPPVPLAYANVDVNINAIDLRIPIDFGVKQGIILDNNSFDQFGPFHARFSISVDHRQQLGRASYEVYPLIIHSLIGLGGGEDFKAIVDIDAIAKFDFIAASSFSDTFFRYVDYSGDLKVYKRKKYCFLGACYKKGWKLDNVVWSIPGSGDNVPLGSDYTQEQVNSSLIEAGANWPLQ